MTELIMEFIEKYEVIIIISLSLCPFLALAIAGLLEANGFEMWRN